MAKLSQVGRECIQIKFFASVKSILTNHFNGIGQSSCFQRRASIKGLIQLGNRSLNCYCFQVSTSTKRSGSKLCHIFGNDNSLQSFASTESRISNADQGFGECDRFQGVHFIGRTGGVGIKGIGTDVFDPIGDNDFLLPVQNPDQPLVIIEDTILDFENAAFFKSNIASTLCIDLIVVVKGICLNGGNTGGNRNRTQTGAFTKRQATNGSQSFRKIKVLNRTVIGKGIITNHFQFAVLGNHHINAFFSGNRIGIQSKAIITDMSYTGWNGNRSHVGVGITENRISDIREIFAFRESHGIVRSIGKGSVTDTYNIICCIVISDCCGNIDILAAVL